MQISSVNSFTPNKLAFKCNCKDNKQTKYKPETPVIIVEKNNNQYDENFYPVHNKAPRVAFYKGQPVACLDDILHVHGVIFDD